MGRPLGRWARDEDGARTGLPFMLWCVRSYIENPEGQYYSTKSQYCNIEMGTDSDHLQATQGKGEAPRSTSRSRYGVPEKNSSKD